MRANSISNLVAAMLIASSFAAAADSRAEVEQKLTSKYTLTVVNAEGGVVTQGVVLTLKTVKGSLTTSAAKSCTNDYKEGKLGLGGNVVGRAGCVAARAPFGIPAPGGGPVRKFVPGEKLYVTKIEAKEDSISFFLQSDPINDAVYRAEVRFEGEKGATLGFERAGQLISEVFDVGAAAPAGGGGGNNQQATPAPAAAAPPPPPLAPIAPPPPPPDQPAPTVSLVGMTPDQVVAAMGQPTRIVDVGPKKIYSYKDVKVTFLNGKVTDVQ